MLVKWAPDVTMFMWRHCNCELDLLMSVKQSTTAHVAILRGKVPSNLILDLTPGFIGLGKDNCKTRRETFKFDDLVRLILDILRYMEIAPMLSAHLLVTFTSWICSFFQTGNTTVVRAAYHTAQSSYNVINVPRNNINTLYLTSAGDIRAIFCWFTVCSLSLFGTPLRIEVLHWIML